MITQFGATIKISATDSKLIEKYKIDSTLEIQNKYLKTSFQRPLWTQNGDYLFFPRFLGIQLLDDTNLRIAATPKIDFKQVGKLQEHQTKIVDVIMRDFFSKEMAKMGAAGVILKLDMGAGKSFIAMNLINLIKRKTLIVCHVSNMISQWRENLENWFENIQVGELSGKKKTDGDIVIGLIQTLSKENIKLQENVPAYKYFSQFGFIIFDEAHLYCSESYSQIFKNCNMPYMLGLSGTPYHEDNSHKIIEWSIGPIFDADSKIEVKPPQFTAEVELVNYFADPEYRKIIKREKEVNYQATLDRILSNPERMQILAEKIVNLASERNVFVFADRRKYLEDIQKLVLQNSSHKMDLIMGGSTDSELAAAVENANIIGTTYQFMSTGRSISKMNGLVFATPRKVKIEQTLGRIFRNGSSMETRKIVDLVDSGTILISQFRVREKIYIERNYTILNTNI